MGGSPTRRLGSAILSGRFITVLVVAGLLVLPSIALAAPSATPQGAASIVSENFNAASTKYTLSPWTSAPYPGTYYWGRLSNKGVGGSGGLWCAGTGGTWPTYPEFSAGYAVFDLPDAADFYEMSATFQYIMASLGDYDANSFALKWVAEDDEAHPAVKSGPTALPKTSAWATKTFALADTALENIGMAGGNLSRRAGHVTFFWADQDEGGGTVTYRTGTGPTLDNVDISGWRYGPVRNLSASAADGNVSVAWARPLRSTRKADVSAVVVEERAIDYGVWRAPTGTSNWTRLTPSAIAATNFTDTSSLPDGWYTYLVQAWDSGDRAGKPAMKDVYAGSGPPPPPPPPPGYLPVFRFYNFKAGVHFYTASEAERANVVAKLASTYKYEGVGYSIKTTNPDNNVPLYRFYNFKAGVHFYTASETEKNNVIAKLSSTYKYEGVAYNVSKTPANGTPVYRFYNLKKGVHFYTASAAEKNNVIANLSSIYKYEGVGYYIGK